MNKTVLSLAASLLLAVLLCGCNGGIGSGATPANLKVNTASSETETANGEDASEEIVSTATPYDLDTAYLTEPGIAPAPVDPEKTEVSDTVCHATLSVRCTDLLREADKLDPDKAELVPEDGYILFAEDVTFMEGETLFDVLRREMKQRGIHMSFTGNAADSAYIGDIGNLYNGDAGELSGWLYFVNGVVPSYSISLYGLKDGDRAEFAYVTDFTAYFD